MQSSYLGVGNKTLFTPTFFVNISNSSSGFLISYCLALNPHLKSNVTHYFIYFIDLSHVDTNLVLPQSILTIHKIK